MAAVAPAEFISIAEETGLIGALGHHVLGAALRTLADWRADGLVSEHTRMNVNLSGRQCEDPELPDQLRAAIRSAGLPAKALTLEVTEGTLMELELSQPIFSEICQAGVGLQLDDFGTGYSSLTALHRFPVQGLKIDRGFVAGTAAAAAGPGGGGGEEAIVRSIVAIAHSLSLPVIAEGIERVDELRRLHALGCEYGQGELIAAAGSEPEVRSMLERWDPANALALGARA